MNDKSGCDEKILCIVTPTKRCYVKIHVLATEFLDKDNNIVHTAGVLPEGEVNEIKITTKTVKHYKNGKLDGQLAMVDLSNDKITFTEQYKDGILLDVEDFTARDSQLLQNNATAWHEGTVVKINKNTQSFYVNGKEVAERTVSADGTTLEQLGEIPDGPVKEYDENGQVRLDANYENNLLEGTLLRYNELGQLLSNEVYTEGKLNGPAQYFTYFPRGIITVQTNYKNAQLDGEWVSSFPTGQPCIKAFYKEGKLQGERLTLYNNGTTNIKETFEKGKLDGVRFIYYEDGNLWYQENYTNGELEGARYGFFTNGNKFLEEFYRNGKLDGYRKTYSEDGHLLSNEEYQDGTLVHHTERKSQK